MGANTASLRQEIEGTRSDLGETLDAIGDRVSPGRVIERRKNRMFQGVESAAPSGDGHRARRGGGVGDVPDMVREGTEGAPDARRSAGVRSRIPARRRPADDTTRAAGRQRRHGQGAAGEGSAPRGREGDRTSISPSRPRSRRWRSKTQPRQRRSDGRRGSEVRSRRHRRRGASRRRAGALGRR